MNPIVLLAGVMTFGGIAFLVWTLAAGTETPGISRRDFASSLGSTDLREMILRESAGDRALKPAITAISAFVRRITPVGRIEALDKKRSMAGLSPRMTIEKILASKVIFAILLALAAYMYKGIGIWPLAAGGIGFILPDTYVKNVADKRQQQIALELPDILDQVTIGVEAGLGFDAAMARAARSSKGPMADEVNRTLSHVAAGLSRAEALRGLAARNKVPELRQFVGAILQADQYGIAMAQVLRVQSGEQRRRRRQRAEEQAMKLPVKILFPLIACIMPALFIVLVGPAALKIKDGL